MKKKTSILLTALLVLFLVPASFSADFEPGSPPEMPDFEIDSPKRWDPPGSIDQPDLEESEETAPAIEQPVTLRINVTDENGKNIALTMNRECWVYIWQLKRGPNMLSPINKGKTDRFGVYNASLQRGDYIVTAQITGFSENISEGKSYTKIPGIISLPGKNVLYLKLYTPREKYKK